MISRGLWRVGASPPTSSAGCRSAGCWPAQAIRARPAQVRHRQHRHEQRVPARRDRHRGDRRPAPVLQGFARCWRRDWRDCAECEHADRGLHGGRQRLVRVHEINGGRGVAVATGAVAGLSIAGLIALLMCFAGGHSRPDRAGRAGRFRAASGVAFVFGGTNGWILGTGASPSWCCFSPPPRGLPATFASTATLAALYQRLVFDERPGRPLMAHAPTRTPTRCPVRRHAFSAGRSRRTVPHSGCAGSPPRARSRSAGSPPHRSPQAG